jgi:Uma2 family endonuclease
MVIQLEHGIVRVPDQLRDLKSFRRWAKSKEFPQQGQYSFLNGDLWIEITRGQEVHHQVKTQVTSALSALIQELGTGSFYTYGMALVNAEADFASEPDGVFLSHASLRDRRARLSRRASSLEVVGSPDMVLEVVSTTSEQKDTILLRDLYWQAGVLEYWLIDPRRNALNFDILRRGPRGYSAARKLRGWVKSPVFGKFLRLSQKKDRQGVTRYRLQVR